MQETWVRSLGWEDPLEKGTATHSSILAWRIPWTVQSTGSQRVRHDFHFHWGPRAQHQRHSPIDSSSEYQHLSFALLFCWKATSVRAIWFIIRMHLQTGIISVVFPDHLVTTFIVQVRKRRLREVETCLLEQALNSPASDPTIILPDPTGSADISHLYSFFFLSFPILSSKRIQMNTGDCSQNLTLSSSRTPESNCTFWKTAYRKHKSGEIFSSYCLSVQCFYAVSTSTIGGKTKRNMNGWMKTSTHFS